MTLTYNFQTGPHDWEGFEYEIEYSDLEKFIDEELPDTEKVGIYIDEIYNVSEEERRDLEENFGISSADELMIAFQNDPEMFSWLSEAIVFSDAACDYVFSRYKDELKERFEDDAADAYADAIDNENYWREVEHDYWKTRI